MSNKGKKLYSGRSSDSAVASEPVTAGGYQVRVPGHDHTVCPLCVSLSPNHSPDVDEETGQTSQLVDGRGPDALPRQPATPGADVRPRRSSCGGPW